MDFSNPAALGDDAAGSNNFTVSGITASDQTPDSPTNNWCTLNTIDEAPYASYKQTFTEGNLRITGPSGGSYQMGTNGTIFSKNKMYYEIFVEATVAGTIMEFGFAPDDYTGSRLASGNKDSLSARPGHTATTRSQTGIVNHGVCVDRSYSLCYYDGRPAGQQQAVPVTSFSVGDIIQCAFDPTHT